MKKIFFSGLLFSFFFVCTLLISEIFISTTHIVEKSLNEVYKDIGRGRRAGMSYLMFNEGFSIGRFNNYRYLGPNYSPVKNKNIIRIALLGDSFVEGFQVFDRHHFRKILEDELSNQLNQKVEVLNFGRSGFDIGDMYAYNKTFVKNFNPDISLFFISNDDLSPQFTDPLKMKVKITKDSLEIIKNYPEQYVNVYNRTKPLIQNSSLFNMLNNGRKTIKSKGIFPILLDKFHPYSKKNIADFQQNNSFELLDITKMIIESFDPTKDILINRDNGQLQSDFVSFLKEKDFTYINLYDTLKTMEKNGVDPYYWKATRKKGHWNQDAHKTIAEYLAIQLLENFK